MDTREKLLQVATRRFAESGFDGVSIAAIADELGLTKQALLHHFASKEKLYGQVLSRISDRFLAQLESGQETGTTAAVRFESTMLDLHQRARSEEPETLILMRELLDNRRRADTAGAWYLKPFLETLVDRLRELPGWQHASPAEALATVYQLLGAINYFAISGPTLRNMFGDVHHVALVEAFPDSLRRQIRAAVANPPWP